MSDDKPRPAPSEGKRLFVGARISIATANALAGVAETLARRARDAGVDVKWVAPVNYHVTLKFLGWTREAAIGAVRDGLDRATRGTPRLSFRTTRLGAFPSLDKASVVWAGIEDGGGLGELAKRIEAAMAELGFVAAGRPYHPHVTLGRLRETRAVKDVVLPLSEQMFGDTRIEAVTLFESETKSSGSVYQEFSRIEFKPPLETLKAGAERQTPALSLDAPKRSSEPEDTDDGWPRGQGPNH
jgi:2'-5' RNA ligase